MSTTTEYTLRAVDGAAQAAGLPTYSELVEALRGVKEWAVIGADSAFARKNGAQADIDAMRALLARIPA